MPSRAHRRLFARRFSARLQLLGHLVSAFGLSTVGLVFVNSARRQKEMRRREHQMRNSPEAVTPGMLVRVEPKPGGALFEFERADLEALFMAHDVIRLSWGPGAASVPYATADRTPWPCPAVALVDRGDEGWEMLSDALGVGLSRQGEIEIRLRGGEVLRWNAPPLRADTAWQQRFEMRPGERFSGLGEQAAGIDLRGGSFAVWNTDAGGGWGPGSGPLYIGVPVVVCTHRDGDLLTFFENSWRGLFDFTASGEPAGSSASASVSFEGGRLQSYVIAGRLSHLLERYSELTGRPALPPRWALGHHQSRWGYKDESDVREVVAGYEREALALSAIHLDIDYMDGYRVFSFDQSRFPDPARLVDDLSSRGVRLVTIVDPGVKIDPSYETYAEGEAAGLFCRTPGGRTAQGVVWPGRSALPDFTNPATRSWWADRYRFLTDRGVAGVWHDMNEPASISLRGDPTLPLDTRHDLDGRGGGHAEAHNLYGLLMNRAGFEGLRRARPERRPFVVSRSGWASNQRWAWNWTGDAKSTWEAMRQQVATLVGLGLSGVPFAGSDIGGFSGVPDDELYLRWLQMSVFMGFCRTHSVVGVPPREPWRFDEPTRSAVEAWIRFRYRLLPYLYTLAHEAARSGAPLMRPLWWPHGDGERADDPRGDALGGVDDEFLLGSSLLVAPVSEPGARGRSMLVPAGEWCSLWARGPSRLQVDRAAAMRIAAPSDCLPVLVRAGTILPLDDGFAQSGGPCEVEGDPPGTDPSGPVSLDHAPRLLSFHCWPTGTARATGVCADDLGDGYGAVRHDSLELTGAAPGATAVLSWRRHGDYAAPSRVRVVLHGFESSRVFADGTEIGATVGGAIECGAFERLELKNLEVPVSRAS